jgi:hypothetical protein
MKDRANSRQHYVPKCYLRQFTPNQKTIFIYDKKEERSFRNSIDTVAYFDMFYELPEKYIENIKDLPFQTKYIEKEFFANSVENIYNQLLIKINSKAKDWINFQKKEEIISKEEKELLSQLIAIQFLRMPNIRDKYVNAEEKALGIRSDIIKSFFGNIHPDYKETLKNISIEHNHDFDPILHSDIYTDEELIYEMGDQLIDKFWVYYVSSNNDFYTSDNPVLIKPHLTNQSSYYDGFGMRGVEIILPIGSSVLLTIWDHNYFKEMETFADTFNHINDKDKRAYNCYQYIWANKQVYSQSDNFTLIELLKMSNSGKEVFMKRPKLKVNEK